MKYSLEKTESQRINVLKTIAIIAVVYIHAYSVEVGFSGQITSLGLPCWLKNVEYFISHVVASFAVPMFFLLSSILLFKTERSYQIVIKQKIKTLVIPYIFWNTLGIAIFIVLQSLTFTAPYFSGESGLIVEASMTDWLHLYGIGASTPKVYPLWFLRDLIVVTFFYPIIKIISEKSAVMALVIGTALALTNGLILFQTAFAWFFIGAAVVQMDWHMQLLDRITVAKSIVVYVVLSVAAFTAQNVFWGKIYIVMAVLFWIRISKEFVNYPLLRKKTERLSPWVFIIYAFHEPAMTGLKKLCLRLLPINSCYLLAEYFIIPVIVIIGCVIFGRLLKKYLPKIYEIAVGNR